MNKASTLFLLGKKKERLRHTIDIGQGGKGKPYEAYATATGGIWQVQVYVTKGSCVGKGSLLFCSLESEVGKIQEVSNSIGLGHTGHKTMHRF